MDPYQYYDEPGAEFGAEFGAEEAADYMGARRAGAARSSLDGVMAGVPPTAVAAGSRVKVTINVTQPFRAERLILDATTLSIAAYNLEQMSISSKEQIITSDGVPASVFSPDATHRLRGTIVRPGVGIVLTFSQDAGGAGTANVKGAIFGPALQA